MSQNKTSSLFLYNPASQDPNELVANFVIRIKEFNELYEVIKNDKMDTPPQHYLIQGQRGYGKTTLQLRLCIEIKRDEELKIWLIPIRFDEEQYHITNLAGLWMEVIDKLAREDSLFSNTLEEAESLEEGDAPEEEICGLLISSLKKQYKKLVIFIDNFGDLLKRFTAKEEQRLREVLITCNSFRLVAASASVLESHYRYDAPLFDFLKVMQLEELNREDTILLLERLGETYKQDEIQRIKKEQPERIDSLRLLTGGVPRTIVLLFEIFTDDSEGNSFKDLEYVLDRVTPLYKHRLDDLPKQQQAIIDAVAQNWDAISTKEIARITKLPGKAVSAQLNELVKNQLIAKEQTSTKNHLYRINERFFNIYYLMRVGRHKNKKRVIWLVRFFEIWYGEEELNARIAKHIDALKVGHLYDRHAYYVTQALAEIVKSPALQHQMISATRNYLISCESEFSDELGKSHLEVLSEISDDLKNSRYDKVRKKLKADGMAGSIIPFFIAENLRSEKVKWSDSIEFYKEAAENKILLAHFYLGNYYDFVEKNLQSAELHYLQAINSYSIEGAKAQAISLDIAFKHYLENSPDYLAEIKDKTAKAMNNLATIYHEVYNDYNKTEKYFLMAIKFHFSPAIFNLALFYHNVLKEFKKAERYYLMAVENKGADAMFNLAMLYQNEFKDYTKAEKYYLMAIQNGYINGMNSLAILYTNELKDQVKAEQYFLSAIQGGNLNAMNNLAILYTNELKNFLKAEQYYLMAVENKDANAMFNLALLYQNEFRDYQKAEKYYLLAVDNNNANAMNNLAALYQDEFKDYTKAEKYYLLAVDNNNANAMYNLAALYHKEVKDCTKAEKYYLLAVDNNNTNAMNNLAALYQDEFKDYTKAEKYYLMAVDNNDANAMHNLAVLYQNEFKDYTKAEKYYLLAVDNNNANAMHNLAALYQNEFKDYIKAEKYYLLAIDNNNANAMNNLAALYHKEFKDYTRAEKYYLMAVENNQIKAMNNIALLYENEFKDYTKAEKYYLMAVENDHANAIFNLALLYENEFKDYTKAEKYFLMAIENNHANAMNNLAFDYYQQKRNKLESVELAAKALKGMDDFYSAHTFIMVSLWNNKIEEAISTYNKYFDSEEAHKEVSPDTQEMFLMFLAKKQVNFMYNIFSENKFDLKDKYKPIYYATVKLLGDKAGDEFLKMPPELAETVDQILEKIEQKAIDYA